MLNRTIVFEIALLLLAFSVCRAQELSARRTAQALTNQDVIEMVGLGLSDGLIIDKVRAAQLTDFDTTVAGLRVTSPVRLSNPLELVVRTPDGTSVTEYQLLRLYEKGNRLLPRCFAAHTHQPDFSCCCRRWYTDAGYERSPSHEHWGFVSHR